MRFLFAVLLCAASAAGQSSQRIPIAGLEQPVEILRDRWGVPHIYARTQHDLFFAQGWTAAKDRLFQIDLWRRAGTGKLSEVLGPGMLERDRFARLVRYRGDLNAEWQSYSPDARAIAAAFTEGINAYIQSRNGRWPEEFARAGYAPGRWVPEDCLARLAGLVMTFNFTREVARAADIRRFGLDTVQKYMPPEPRIPIQIPQGLDLDIPFDVVKVYQEATLAAEVPVDSQGSNNWVVDGTLTTTGKPILANDPHRPILVPSLRKTVHLVAPGWNAMGAGEPSLPGIALGHNDNIAFGFTIVGIDQQDLYVEKLNPANPGEYWFRNAWKKVEIERQQIAVKGAGARTVELRYTVHGPVLHEDRRKNRAYVLRWVGSQPGGAGYLAALGLSRARNWSEFLAAMGRYLIPSENMVYADRQGNIGWRAAGQTPLRRNWSGLLPVPGDGTYEWSGFVPPDQMPTAYNPPSHFIATANNNILPPGYGQALSYEWTQPFRVERIREVLSQKRKFSVEDFQRLQQDTLSIPARRFQAVLRRWQGRTNGRRRQMVDLLLGWDCRLEASSKEALLFELWLSRLPQELYGASLGLRVDLNHVLGELESKDHARELESTLDAALRDLDRHLGPNPVNWQWGRVNVLRLIHPLKAPEWSMGPILRGGDGFTVNAFGLGSTHTASGASYRQILDTADWDRSVMTNLPGESGDPASPHYRDLLEPWARGEYHPMPFSRKAVEAATSEKMLLVPATAQLRK